jgi:DUF1009 family protein
MSRIGILAGGGRLPLTIAESLAARGEGVHIVAIEGEADPAVARFPHTWVNWGQIGRMVATLRGEGAEALVIAGTVRRPNLRHIRPDAGFFRCLPQIVAMLGGGDDSVLTRVVRFFERQGLRVSGVHEVVPELLAGAGSIAHVPLADRERVDAEIGFAARRALAPVDTGQAVVVAEGRVLAIEGPEGTDAMLQRVAAASGGAGPRARRGVLAKGPKPGQERRVDLPAIGPRTIEQAAAAGLAAVVVEAGGVLVLDRPQVIAAADAAGCAVHGLDAGSAIEIGLPRPAIGRRVGRVIGRRRPGRRDAVDVVAGLTAVEALAPFAAGASAVVVRNFLLALEGAEGPSAVLERAARLRQWGLRWRKVGVFVRRAEAGGGDAGAIAGLFSQAAAQELAGIAVTGTSDALAPYEEAARLADDLGLFLVLCESGLA